MTYRYFVFLCAAFATGYQKLEGNLSSFVQRILVSVDAAQF
jgi:hypothetical protein